MLPMLRNASIPSFTADPFFGRLGELRREIDRWFDSTLSENLFSSVWTPAMDVEESEDSLRLSFEVPGVNPEDLRVTFENGVLTLTLPKTPDAKPKQIKVESAPQIGAGTRVS